MPMLVVDHIEQKEFGAEESNKSTPW